MHLSAVQVNYKKTAGYNQNTHTNWVKLGKYSKQKKKN